VAGLLPFGEADGLWRSLVSALRSGRRGPRFKSGQPDHEVPDGSVVAGRALSGRTILDAILRFDPVTAPSLNSALGYSAYRWFEIDAAPF
jgi:hypothetical protein